MPLFKTEKSNIPSNLLSDRYIVPPFSILNTITQGWQKRKDVWEELGIDSVKGRDVKRYNAMPVNTFSARGADAKEAERTSTFDPVLCEIIYKWFSHECDTVLDPFAGGSVRGIVAGMLNRQYIGIDLSPTQVETNYEQLEDCKNRYNIDGDIKWVCGDSLDTIPSYEEEFDILFTCPPYYNIEKYSKDPRDLCNMPSYEYFLIKYETILSMAYRHLRENSFAVIVVSEVRNPDTGEYYGLVPDTIKAMTRVGFKYYNEIILYNNIGSLPIRAPKYFDQSRKIGRTHQNILVFYKGDLSTIESEFGKFENT